MPIRARDRVFIAGQSSSGKSELLNVFFTQVTCQKILLDTKGEFAIAGVPMHHRADDIEWDAPEAAVIHYNGFGADLDEYDRIAYDALHRRHIVICCHELGDLCDDQPNRTPKWIRKAIRQGNVFDVGWLAGSQRPVGMPRQARTEAQHVIQMVPALDPEDHRIVARMFGCSDHELHEHIREAAQLSPTGQYSWIWDDKRRRLAGGTLLLMPPLPDEQRRAIMVTRTAQPSNLAAEDESGQPPVEA